MRFLNISAVIATNVEMAPITSLASSQSGWYSSCGIMQFAETGNVLFSILLSLLSVCLRANYTFNE